MDENNFITLKLIGFNELDRNNLTAILVLATRALKEKWQLVETDAADFFLFSSELSAPMLNEEVKNYPLERCMFCTPKTAPQTTHTLPVDTNGLPRLSSLVELFNRHCANSTAEHKPPAMQPTVTEAENEQFFDPRQGLLKHLLATESAQLIINLEHNNYPALYIDIENNTYYSQNKLAQLEPYVLTSQTLLIEPCSAIVFKNHIDNESLKPQPLKDLIWYATLKTSAGKVIKGYTNTDIVTLKNWPDLRLSKYLDYARLAAFMKNNAATLQTIAEYTKTPLTEVSDFYNACYLIGLIEQRSQVEINQKNLNPDRLELLAKIDARLKNNNN
jgi:hypothetical protein